jgi:hypothetical protein
VKKVDIIPGAVAAIAADRVFGYGRAGYKGHSHGVEAVREGISAAPARIIDVGKWRAQRQGACDVEYINDGFTAAALVDVVDIKATFPKDGGQYGEWGQKYGDPTMVDRPGMPDGLKLTSKRVKWKRSVVPLTSLIYPWDHFLKLREERLFAQAEYAEYRRRNEVVLRELGELLAPVAAALPAGSKYSFDNLDVGRFRWSYDVTLNVPKLVESGALNGSTAKVKALYDEHVFLVGKLACRI